MSLAWAKRNLVDFSHLDSLEFLLDKLCSQEYLEVMSLSKRPMKTEFSTFLSKSIRERQINFDSILEAMDELNAKF